MTEATQVGVVVDIVRAASEEPESNYANNIAAALARVIGPLVAAAHRDQGLPDSRGVASGASAPDGRPPCASRFATVSAALSPATPFARAGPASSPALAPTATG